MLKNILLRRKSLTQLQKGLSTYFPTTKHLSDVLDSTDIQSGDLEFWIYLHFDPRVLRSLSSTFPETLPPNEILDSNLGLKLNLRVPMLLMLVPLASKTMNIGMPSTFKFNNSPEVGTRSRGIGVADVFVSLASVSHMFCSRVDLTQLEECRMGLGEQLTSICWFWKYTSYEHAVHSCVCICVFYFLFAKWLPATQTLATTLATFWINDRGSICWFPTRVDRGVLLNLKQWLILITFVDFWTTLRCIHICGGGIFSR